MKRMILPTLQQKIILLREILFILIKTNAVIYIDSDKSSNIVVKDNMLRGDNRFINVVGDNKENIFIENND